MNQGKIDDKDIKDIDEIVKNYIDNNSNNKTYKNNIINSINKNKTNINGRIIPIAISLNDEGIRQALVLLTSLLENKSKETRYSIYILVPSCFSYKSKIILHSLVEKYGQDNIKLTYIDMKDSFSTLNSTLTYSTVAYYRINLPSILPDLDKIIYLDIDIIAFKDLTEIYNLELKDDIYFLSYPDYTDFKDRTLSLFGEKITNYTYYNSGVLLMILRSIRKYGIEKKLGSCISKARHLACGSRSYECFLL